MAAMGPAGGAVAGAPPRNFAERLQALGAEFDREVRCFEDAAAAAARSEARALREQVDRLADQLELERSRHAAQLASERERWEAERAQQSDALGGRLQEQLEQTEQELQREVLAKEFWQQEYAAIEEKRDILEAKLAGALLTSEAHGCLHCGTPCARCLPPAAAPQASASPEPPRCGERRAADQGPVEAVPDDDYDDVHAGSDAGAASPGGCLRLLAASPDEDAEAVAEVELRLAQLPEESFGPLLAAAAGRHDGGRLVPRVARSWLGRLVAGGGAAALRAAVRAGSAEALAAVLSLGGAPAATAAAVRATGSPGGGGEPGVLDVCVEKGDANMLALLLESLRGAGGAAVEGVRRAQGAAAAAGDKSCAAPLAYHLVVELSLLGNTRYRQGELQSAIGCYEEAIELCAGLCRGQEAVAAAAPQPGPPGDGGPGETFTAESQRNNLVRLRYNLARALHRTDRWAEAREQATKVLQLDPLYGNAYALRAQAAMAAWDWREAADDWRALLDVAGLRPGEALAPGGADQPCREGLAAWRRRLEECERQLSITHYEALELPRLSGVEAVKRAYREIARRWHPDKHRHRPQDHQERAKRRFARVREAYEVLCDEGPKRAYDARLLLVEARPLCAPQLRGQDIQQV